MQLLEAGLVAGPRPLEQPDISLLRAHGCVRGFRYA